MEERCINSLNKKRKIEDSIADIMQQNSLSIDEMNKYFKSLARKLAIDWISILCMDWLSTLFLPFLTLPEITRLDSAICFRKLRPEWLNNLKKHSSLVSLNFFVSINWSDALVDWIIARDLHFSELTIKKGYSKISNDGIYQLAQQCPDLKKLKICNNELLKNDKRLQFLAAICDKLENIELFDGFPMCTEDFTWLGACNQLQSITMITNSSPTAADVKALFGNKTKLKTVIIRNGCLPQLLSELGINCPLLEHLSISKLEYPLAMHIEVFTKGCTKLKSLRIRSIIDNDDESNNIVKDMLIDGLGKNCPHLESLLVDNIVPSRFEKTYSMISESSFKSLAQGCPLLQKIDFRNISILSAQGVKHLADHCLMLTDISLYNCRISDDVMAELGKMRSLKSLHIWECQDITDEGIEALVKDNGSNLQSLDISCCDKLTDASLSSISDHCPNLQTISVGGYFKNMTLVGMMRLARKCKKLIYFYYNGLDWDTFDISMVERVVDERRKLEE